MLFQPVYRTVCQTCRTNGTNLFVITNFGIMGRVCRAAIGETGGYIDQRAGDSLRNQRKILRGAGLDSIFCRIVKAIHLLHIADHRIGKFRITMERRNIRQRNNPSLTAKGRRYTMSNFRDSSHQFSSHIFVVGTERTLQKRCIGDNIGSSTCMELSDCQNARLLGICLSGDEGFQCLIDGDTNLNRIHCYMGRSAMPTLAEMEGFDA